MWVSFWAQKDHKSRIFLSNLARNSLDIWYIHYEIRKLDKILSWSVFLILKLSSRVMTRARICMQMHIFLLFSSHAKTCLYMFWASLMTISKVNSAYLCILRVFRSFSVYITLLCILCGIFRELNCINDQIRKNKKN